MEIFDVFSMNGIENYPAAGEFKKKMLFLRSHSHTFPRISTPIRGLNFSRGGCEVPWTRPWQKKRFIYNFFLFSTFFEEMKINETYSWIICR